MKRYEWVGIYLRMNVFRKSLIDITLLWIQQINTGRNCFFLAHEVTVLPSPASKYSLSVLERVFKATRTYQSEWA